MGASCYGSHVGAMLYELETTPRLGAPTGGYVGGIGGPLLGNMLQPLSKAHVLVGKRSRWLWVLSSETVYLKWHYHIGNFSDVVQRYQAFF